MAEPNLNQDNSPSYGHILKDLTEHTKDLIQGEMDLVKADLQTVLPRVVKHSRDSVIFGAICALSVFPLLSFLVIGLGGLLGGNYWLSSLIVFVVFAAVGGPVAMKSLQKIKNEDFNFSRTKEGVNRGVKVVQDKIQDVVAAAKGESHEYRH